MNEALSSDLKVRSEHEARLSNISAPISIVLAIAYLDLQHSLRFAQNDIMTMLVAEQTFLARPLAFLRRDYRNRYYG